MRRDQAAHVGRLGYARIRAAVTTPPETLPERGPMLPKSDDGEVPRALQHLLTRDGAHRPAQLPRRSFLKLAGAGGLAGFALGAFPHMASAQASDQPAGGLKPTQQPSAFVQIAPNGEV